MGSGESIGLIKNETHRANSICQLVAGVIGSSPSAAVRPVNQSISARHVITNLSCLRGDTRIIAEGSRIDAGGG